MIDLGLYHAESHQMLTTSVDRFPA